jgi:hypothetical protein
MAISMLKLPEDLRNPTIVGFFHRHVVPIYFDFRKENEDKQEIFTAFVLSVNDQWLLITAGHNIRYLKGIRAAGWIIEQCKLIDCMGTGAIDKTHLQPFDYDGSDPTALSDDPCYDYGILFIRDNTRALLEANGVVALTELSWEQVPEAAEIQEYKVLGIPAQFSAPTPDRAFFHSTLHRVEVLYERPEGFEETNAPMFYGRIKLGEVMTEAKGLSGAPIFAIATVDGRIRYWLHAMQVSWVRSDRTISGMLIKPLGNFLREIMQGRRDHLFDQRWP